MTKGILLLSILPPFWPKMPPLGILYLKEYLNSKGVTADILDLNNFFYNLAGMNNHSPLLQKSWTVSCNTFLEKNVLSIIKTNFPGDFNDCVNKILEYDMAGFSCFKSNYKTTIEVIKILKSRKSGIKIVLGGPEIARQYFKTDGKFNDEILNLADLLIAGEGEKPLYDFIAGVNNHPPLPTRNNVSKFIQLEDLKCLPFPRFNGIGLKSYPKNNAVPVLFSRGCARKCNFCSERLLYKGFRSRPVGNVINEIKFHSQNGIKYFVFFDSMLNADLKKFEGLLDAVISNFGNILWEAQIAVRNDMDMRIFEKMKKSGCYNLFIGLESGSDKTLKNMNKGFTSKGAEEFFRKLKEAGLFFGISLITGYPGETEEDFKESLDFVIKNKNLIPKIEQINPFTYYDGTNTDKKADYKLNKESMRRMEIFVEEIKKHNFKYINAFLGNLVEKI
ncbi:MAG: radical SAM protein [bacterium]